MTAKWFTLISLFFIATQPAAPAAEILPTVNISVSGATNIMEGQTSSFTVTRNPVSINPIIVYLEAFYSSQPVNLETPLPSELRINAGSATATVSVRPQADAIPEPDFAVTLRILPHTNYIIGPGSQTTITIRDNDLWGTFSNVPPVLRLNALPSIISTKSNLLATVSAVDGQANVLLIQLLSGEEVVAESTAWRRNATNITFEWKNPPPGRHMISAAAYDELGGHTNTAHAEVMVAVDILKPSLLAMPQNFLAIEFDIPPEAASLESYLHFTSTSAYGGNRVYVYEGKGSDSTVILTQPREFLTTTIGNAKPNPTWDIDVTRGSQRYAGKKLGLLIEGNSFPGTPPYFGFELALMSPETRDRSPSVRLLGVEGPIIPHRGDTVTLRAEIISPDARVWTWRIIDSNRVAASSIVNLPIGTNVISAPISNLSTGVQIFRMEVSASEWLATSESTNIFVAELGREPQYRPLGFGPNTKSFYVIDDSGQALVWGENSSGQLGLGFTSGPVNVPITLPAPNGLEFRQIIAGPRQAIAIMNDGSLWGWGANDLSQIMIPATDKLLVPTPVPIPSYASGVYFFLKGVPDTNETFYVQDQATRFRELPLGTFGATADDLSRGGMGQLWLINGRLAGNPTIPSIYIPQTRWIDISAGPSQMLAIGTNNQMYGWGFNRNGQLPRPPQDFIPYPILITNVAGVSGWTRVEPGLPVSLATDISGRLFWWGEGFGGQESAPNVAKEVEFAKGKTNWLDFTVTATYAMALNEQRELFVWGLAGAQQIDLPQIPQAQAISASLTGGEAVFKILGPKNIPIVIELSSDLVTWFEVDEIPNPTGQVNYHAQADEEKFFLRIGPPR